ncbi:hypothetical protein [Marinoscillum sp. MHG1-6]|uniref:nSTAND1 domain-containing NTPase n=1 Tax=Marinoscillum sp. MHG1-6 TaxID=2959627 RepID=UPI0021572031|nr:hypothetical protein [Marinoscillum sp. MHG1-6]
MSEKEIKIDEGQDIVDITELINPFPGLRPFGIEESHLFFGREGQSDEVLVKLAENRFVAILGSSGSGKSSFMYCGLVPSLNGGFMTEAGSNWRTVVARPGGGPIDNLAEALLIKDKAFSSLSEEDKLIKKTIIGTVLRSSSLGLVEVIKQLKTDDDQNILVVIDQFEELFRFRKLEAAHSDMDESSAFVNLLLEAIHQFEEPIYVTITMRSDFIGECAKFPDLTQMINDSHYLIPQMTRDQKRNAIDGPVAVGGGKIAPRLIQQLLNDVGDNPDQLPILQHALMRTWSFWVDNRKHGEMMDLRHYNAIGTLREALSQHANEAYDSLSKREKEICEVMFKSLTERGSENQGIRRPTKLGTIASIAGVTDDEVIHVVDKFREPGRSLLMPPYGIRLESETVIDISHESLMRIWDRLKRWLDEESKAAEMYLKLSEAAERFQQGRASLWKMPDLQLALNWREENKPTLVWGQRYNPAFERTIVFLETSEKAYITEQRNKELLQKRQIKRMRFAALFLGFAVLVSLFFIINAYLQKGYAEEALVVAEEQRQRAEDLQVEAEKNAEEAILERNKATKAQKEAEEQREEAVKQTAIAEAQTEIANAEKAKAEVARIAADEARVVAEDAQKEAQRNAKIAEEQRIQAENLRMQSIAQSMAIKATKIQNDDELKAVVAKQAFLYNEEYGDPNKNYNGDIYAGIYYGLQGVLDTKETIDVDGEKVTYSLNDGDSVMNQYRGYQDIVDPETGIVKNVGVKSVLYSADGNKMYSAGSDGRLLVWDMKSGKRQYKEIFRKTAFSSVANISPDEKYLALGTNDANILLIDLKNPSEKPKKIEGHRGGSVYDLVFLPESSQKFISTGADNRVLLHTEDTNEEIALLTAKPTALAINYHGTRIAVGTDRGEIYMIDLTSEGYEKTKIVYKKGSEQRIQALDFSHDDRLLAIGDYEGVVTVWDLEKRERSGPRLTGFTSPVTVVQFSPDDKLILASSTDQSVRMWDTENIYDLPTVFDDHTDWVNSVDFAPTGDRFVTACEDGIIRLFETTPDNYAARICGLIGGNMSDTEWSQYVGEDIDYVTTCEGLPQREDD